MGTFFNRIWWCGEFFFRLNGSRNRIRISKAVGIRVSVTPAITAFAFKRLPYKKFSQILKQRTGRQVNALLNIRIPPIQTPSHPLSGYGLTWVLYTAHSSATVTARAGD